MLSILALTLVLAAPPAPAASPGSAPPATDSAPARARDPFMAPRETPSDPALGLRGMAWQHLRLGSVVASPRGNLATLDGGASGTFFAREGDLLANATVVKVDVRRRAVLLRESLAGSEQEYRDIVLTLDSDRPLVRERPAAEPILKVR